MRQRSMTRGLMMLGLGALLVGTVVALAMAGETGKAPVKEYTGQIKSIKIDKCGLQPGTCEGSIVLAPKGGPEVALAILPGTWIRRGDQLVTIDELGVGNYIMARATPLPQEARRPGTVGSDPGERAILLEETTGE
jgi:hypothetical protein